MATHCTLCLSKCSCICPATGMCVLSLITQVKSRSATSGPHSSSATEVKACVCTQCPTLFLHSGPSFIPFQRTIMAIPPRGHMLRDHLSLARQRRLSSSVVPVLALETCARYTSVLPALLGGRVLSPLWRESRNSHSSRPGGRLRRVIGWW